MSPGRGGPAGSAGARPRPPPKTYGLNVLQAWDSGCDFVATPSLCLPRPLASPAPSLSISPPDTRPRPGGGCWKGTGQPRLPEHPYPCHGPCKEADSRSLCHRADQPHRGSHGPAFAERHAIHTAPPGTQQPGQAAPTGALLPALGRARSPPWRCQAGGPGGRRGRPAPHGDCALAPPAPTVTGGVSGAPHRPGHPTRPLPQPNTRLAHEATEFGNYWSPGKH